jgi:uncharacterized protein (TIGR02147 family)
METSVDVLALKLRTELMVSQQRNPAYSLRAFSKKLDLSPSVLCEVLNGKRPTTKKMAIKVMDKLSVDPIEKVEILKKYDLTGESLKELQKKTKNKIDYNFIASDNFFLINRWYHLAILSLIETTDFKPRAKWIAKRLNILVEEATEALERLERLNYIKWDRKNHTIKLLSGPITTDDDIASMAIKGAHYDDLRQAELALENVAFESRDFTALTLAINTKKIPQAKKIIREFQDRLAQLLETGTQDEVYKFTCYLYPLTNNNNDNIDKKDDK